MQNSIETRSNLCTEFGSPVISVVEGESQFQVSRAIGSYCIVKWAIKSKESSLAHSFKVVKIYTS